mmetsp:Transcript_23858/g.35255  ORF Transcript_23858/g.35255 Transcript_23858/m.35255 type:complete len:105 (+) Transcript_23858:647-961(+)
MTKFGDATATGAGVTGPETGCEVVHTRTQSSVGWTEGNSVGCFVGDEVGLFEGSLVGRGVGKGFGAGVTGLSDGASDNVGLEVVGIVEGGEVGLSVSSAASSSI